MRVRPIATRPEVHLYQNEPPWDALLSPAKGLGADVRGSVRVTKTLTKQVPVQLYNLNYFASLRKQALRVGEMAQQAKAIAAQIR